MALFGKKEKQEEVQQELDMLVTTTENIGRPYEVLGLVTAKTRKTIDFDYETTTNELVQRAMRIEADAIVGFKYEISNTGSITDIIAYGTAVKFK
ncbi:heavy metal-binding domain-containing protein [Aneurinibacillus migulanus]|uniref:Putative heavy-metal-binding n=1 Tax=Aneurinibacillus migulanus TaxID=47500 RepID=A0A0D1VV01_ANEMI|nr:heavy metal-binding domain-containing protein [Aneurinibacillus migulanus]KIV50080.1 hypothetical protein TS65_29935 [Aneurinibacillus migulanus]KON95241.1 hypothetical protein AF333_06855 [Aneurinibacillus migulanus]MED0895738.1 heavy metal-binding domain-containing protein [Aneurinibacillus migulanus]MED1619264.1 heavy metal-binding domain-containing protein [Aneurinibacillus migulanus]SDK33176.1 Putative heavy-metal-binding [Aneurinibacillus migulanus]